MVLDRQKFWDILAAHVTGFDTFRIYILRIFQSLPGIHVLVIGFVTYNLQTVILVTVPYFQVSIQCLE